MLETQPKAQKTHNSSLISNKNLSELLPSSSWAHSQVTWAKMAKNQRYLWRHPQKNETQNLKTVFINAN